MNPAPCARSPRPARGRHHTAVELAQRAEQLGLARRMRDERDHRQVRLGLTAEGRRALEQVTRGNLAALGELAERLAQVVADGQRS